MSERQTPFSNDIQRSVTVVITQNLSSTGSKPWTIYLNQYQVDFNVKYVKLRNLIYANISGTDAGVYNLYSDLTGQNIASAYVNSTQTISQNSESVFPVTKPLQQITFQLIPGVSSTYVTPTGYISFTMEFLG